MLIWWFCSDPLIARISYTIYGSSLGEAVMLTYKCISFVINKKYVIYELNSSNSFKKLSSVVKFK